MPVPSLTSVVSMLSGIFAILPVVYVDSNSAAIEQGGAQSHEPARGDAQRDSAVQDRASFASGDTHLDARPSTCLT